MRGGLVSSYQEGRAGIQLSRGGDSVIKRGGLGYSYQEGRVGIPLTGLTPPHVPNQDLDFQCHMPLCFLCSVRSVKMRGGCFFW